MVTKSYCKQLGFYREIVIKVSFRSKNSLHLFDNIKMIQQ